ncbi:hypothetical protein AB6A40_011594 [Gnathostoma spinigerum]|uniref:Uncharacterized protein n=1 Tax=Gnathostoma spinigerum TaxID=75299 RepID=A0ABD6F4U4_9BILA
MNSVCVVNEPFCIFFLQSNKTTKTAEMESKHDFLKKKVWTFGQSRQHSHRSTNGSCSHVSFMRSPLSSTTYVSLFNSADFARFSRQLRWSVRKTHLCSPPGSTSRRCFLPGILFQLAGGAGIQYFSAILRVFEDSFRKSI